MTINIHEPTPLVPEKFVVINGIKINSKTITLPDDRSFHDSWYLEGSVIAFDQAIAKEIVRTKITAKCVEICADGIVWNGSQFGYTDGPDRDLKVSMLAQLSDGEISPHAGYIKDLEGNEILLSDADALAMLKTLRAYVPKVVQTSHSVKNSLPDAHVELFDVSSIQWPDNVFV